VSCISNTQQARTVPNSKAINSNSQQLDVGSIVEFAEAGSEARDLPAEGRQTALAYLIEPSLRDHVRALPIVLAIEHLEDPAGIDRAQGLSGIDRTPRQAHPQIAFCLLGDKTQEIPLRPEGEKPTMCRKMCKIGDLQKTSPICARQASSLTDGVDAGIPLGRRAKASRPRRRITPIGRAAGRGSSALHGRRR
jgi:hypothetical protein